MVPFDSLARAEHYGTYLPPHRFDAQVWGPTTLYWWLQLVTLFTWFFSFPSPIGWSLHQRLCRPSACQISNRRPWHRKTDRWAEIVVWDPRPYSRRATSVDWKSVLQHHNTEQRACRERMVEVFFIVLNSSSCYNIASISRETYKKFCERLGGIAALKKFFLNEEVVGNFSPPPLIRRGPNIANIAETSWHCGGKNSKNCNRCPLIWTVRPLDGPHWTPLKYRRAPMSFYRILRYLLRHFWGQI